MPKKKRVSNYVLVGRVKSASNPKKTYEIKVRKGSKTLSCNCPDWIYRASRLGRPCKHIQEIIAT